MVETDDEIEEAISVSVRVRPLNGKERRAQCEDVWRVAEGESIFCNVEGQQSQRHTFDNVFEPNTSTAQVYDRVARGLVSSVLCGMNGTVFAYGQTASGKTFTMQGEAGSPGVLGMAAEQVFDEISHRPHFQFLLRVSYIEVFNEQVKDLLSDSDDNLRIREDRDRGFFVDNLQMKPIKSVQELLQAKEEGERRRHVGETNMNMRSSRSHTIFSLRIEMRDSRVKDEDEDEDGEVGPETATPEKAATGRKRRNTRDNDCRFGVLVGNLNLVDLAGSENARATGAEGGRLKEGGNINRSLLTLSRVISQLASKGKVGFINWRDSKLTQILQPSLAGNCRTAIVCCITPASKYIEESKSTLSFASRAKQIRTRAIVNEVLDGQGEMRKLKHTIQTLRSKLASQQEINAEKTALETQLQNLKALFLTGGVSADTAAAEGPVQEANIADGKKARKRRKKKHRETWCPGDFQAAADELGSPEPASSTGELKAALEADKRQSGASFASSASAGRTASTSASGDKENDLSAEDGAPAEANEEPLFASERIAALQAKLAARELSLKEHKELLEKIRADHQAECLRAAEELEAQQQIAKTAQADLEHSVAVKEQSRELLEEKNNECADLKEEIAKLREQLADRTAAATTAEQALKQMQEDETALLESTADAQRELKAANVQAAERLEAASASLREAEGLAAERLEQVERLEKELELVRHQLEGHAVVREQSEEASKAELSANKVDLEHKVAHLEHVLVTAELEKDRSRDLLEACEAKLEAARTVLVSACDDEEEEAEEDALDDLPADKMASKVVARLQALVAERPDTAALESQIAEYKAQISEMADSIFHKEEARESELKEARAALAEAQEARAIALERLDLQRETIRELEEAQSAAAQAAAQAEQAAPSLEEELAAGTQAAQADALQAELEQLKEQLAEDAQGRKKAEEAAEQLAQSLDSARESLGAMEAKAKTATDTVASLEARLLEMSEAANAAEANAAELEAAQCELAALREESAALAAALEGAAEVSESAAEERSRLQDELSHAEVAQVLSETLAAVEVAAVTESRDEYQTVVAKLQAERAQLGHQQQQQQRDLSGDAKRVEQLEVQAGLAEQQAQALAVKLAALQEELVRKTAESDEAATLLAEEAEAHAATRERLRAEKCEWESRTGVLQSSMQALQAEIERLQAAESAQARSSFAMHESTEATSESLKKRLSQVQLRLDLAVQERDKALAKLEAADARFADAQGQASTGEREHSAELEALQTALKAAEAEKSKLGARLAEASEKADKAEALLDGATRETEERIAAARAEAAAAAADGVATEAQEKLRQELKESYMGAISALEKKVAALKEGAEEKKAVAERLQARLEEAEAQLAEAESKIGAGDDAEELREELERARQQLAKGKQELAVRTQELAELRTRLERKESESVRLMEVEAKAAEDRARVETLRAEMQELENEAQSQKATAEAAVSARAEAEQAHVQELTDLHMQLTEAKAQLSKAGADAGPLREELAEQSARMEALQRELAASKERVEKLERVKLTQEQANQIKAMKKDHKELKANYRALKLELAEVNAANKTLTSSQRQLRAQLEGVEGLNARVADLARRFGVVDAPQPAEFFDMLASRLSALQEERDRLQAALREVDADTEAAERVEELQSELASTREALEKEALARRGVEKKLATVSHQHGSAAAESSGRVAELEIESSRLRERLAEFEKDFKEAREEHDKDKESLVANLEEQKSAIRFLEKENLDLMVELRKLREQASTRTAAAAAAPAASSTARSPVARKPATARKGTPTAAAKSTPLSGLESNTLSERKRRSQSHCSEASLDGGKPALEHHRSQGGKENSSGGGDAGRPPKQAQQSSGGAGLDENNAECTQQ